MGQQEDTPISDGAALDAPRASDELYQAFVNEPTPVGIDPTDGMPRHQVPHSIRLALAPALDPKTFVCAGEDGEFAIRNSWGDALATFDEKDVSRGANGDYRVPLQVAYERLKDSMAIKRVREMAKKHDKAASERLESGDPFLFVHTCLSNALLQHVVSIDWVQVRPARPQCAHYVRQLTDFTDDPDHMMITRLCTARRTDEGEFLSLRDGRMYACELREPRHMETERKLDDFDARAIAMGREAAAKETETFDVDAALAQQAQASGATEVVDADDALRAMAASTAAELGLNLADAVDSIARTQSLGILGVAVDGEVEVGDDDE